MKTLESIQAKIAELQKEADEITARERDVVINRCIEAMKTYGITLKDLSAKRKTVVAPQPSAKSLAMRSRVKYRLEDQTWSGFGRKPQWLQEWLKKRSNKLEQLLVE